MYMLGVALLQTLEQAQALSRDQLRFDRSSPETFRPRKRDAKEDVKTRKAARLSAKGTPDVDAAAQAEADRAAVRENAKIMPAYVDAAEKGDVVKQLAAIDKLLGDYVTQYAPEQFNPDNKFILGIYGCPRQFGNRMHEFLNDFALAVVTGRTIVWDYTGQASGVFDVGSQAECDAVLHRKKWLLHKNVTIDLGLKVANYDLKDWHEVGCTEWDQLKDDVIKPGKLEQYQSYGLALEGSALRGPALGRAKTLFALGPEVAFGKLFSASFEFEESVTEPTLNVLREAALVDEHAKRVHGDSTWVAMHLRHKSLDITAEQRADFANVTWTQALEHLKGRSGPCAVLLATDDEVTEPFLKPVVAEEGCALVRSDLGEVDKSWSGEHGAHTGVGALRDIQLLSKADVFVGTSWSSFTQTIAEQLLSRKPAAPFYQCMMACSRTRGSFPVPFGSPGCGLEPEEAVEKTSFRAAPSAQEGHLASESIDTLIGTYISDHRSGSLDHGGQVVVGTYGCPKQLGSRMHEFLNSFAIAVVTGRSFAWEQAAQASEEDCHAHMERQGWIPSFAELATSRGNAIDVRSAGELACSAGGASFALRPYRFEEYQALALSLPGANLTEEQAHRAHRLFALGPEVAYGRLLRAAFKFSEAQVVQPTYSVLREAGLIDAHNGRADKSSVWVAVHAQRQHEQLGDEGLQFASVLWNQTSSFLHTARGEQGDRPCTILLATDDEEMRATLGSKALQEGCALVQSDLGTPEGSVGGAHGELAERSALRDIYLLSLADMVVGTSWSAFTQTIAELVLSRNPSAAFAQCSRKFCDTQKTAFPRPDGDNECGL